MKNFKKFLIEKDHRKKIVQNVGLTDTIANTLHNLNDKYSLWFANQIRDSIIKWSQSHMEQLGKLIKDPTWADKYLDNPGFVMQNAEVIGEFNILNVDAVVDLLATPLELVYSYNWVIKKEKNPNNRFHLNELITRLFDNNEVRTAITGILDWIRGQEGQVSIKDYDFETANQAQQEWHQGMVATGGAIEDEDGRIVMRFPDGFYWIDLETTYSDEEHSAMGHCGRCMKEGGVSTLYSLRDKKKAPHVTAEIEKEYGNEYYQMKGKQNIKPIEKYHPYIVGLLIHNKIDKYESAYNYPTDFHPSDLDDELFIKLVTELPSILNIPDALIRAYKMDMIDFNMIKKITNDIKNLDMNETTTTLYISEDKFSSLKSIVPFEKFLPHIVNKNYKSDPGEFIHSLTWYNVILKGSEFYNVINYYARRVNINPTADLKDKINELYDSNKYVAEIIDSMADIISKYNQPVIYVQEVDNSEKLPTKGYFDDEFYKIEIPTASFMDMLMSRLSGNQDSGLSFNDPVSILSEYINQTEVDLNREESIQLIQNEVIELLRSVVLKDLETTGTPVQADSQDMFGFDNNFEQDYNSNADRILQGIYNEQRRHSRRTRYNIH